jgi:hypothetical protein
MAHKSGLSHAFAALVALFIGAILTEYLRSAIPGVIGFLERAAEVLAGGVEAVLGIHIEPPVFTPALIVFLLCFAWGVAYHIARSRRG